MPFNLKQKVLLLILLLAMVCVVSRSPQIGAQEQAARKVLKRVQPAIPDIAVQLRLSGTVKLTAQVTAEGKVRSVHITGGNAILASAAENAVKQWTYAPAQKETSEAVEISFVRP
jgi:TonB family protein